MCEGCNQVLQKDGETMGTCTCNEKKTSQYGPQPPLPVIPPLVIAQRGMT